jgi:hypothetical protein
MNKNRLMMGILNTITAVFLMFSVLVNFVRLSSPFIVFSFLLVIFNMIYAVYNFRIVRREE